MRIVRLIKYIFISIVLLSTFSYNLLAEKIPILSIAFSFLIIFGIWMFGNEKRIKPSTSLVLSIFFTVFFLIDVSVISRNLLYSGNHLLILLTLHRLLTLKNEKDYFLILLFSFLTISSSGSLSPNLSFLILFFVFIFLSIFSLTLLSLYKGNFRIKKSISLSLIRISLVSTLTIFLVSPVIFFTVPRLGMGFGTLIGSNPPLVSGFTESVNLGDIGKIIENNRVVMRVLTAGSKEIPADHLWRGKGYNHFDGKGWSSTLMASKGAETKKRYYKEKRTIAIVNLEPIGTDVLFIPYNLEWIGGIRMVKEDANGTISSLFGAYTKRTYTVEFRDNPQKIIPFDETDLKPFLQLPEFNQNIFKLAREVAGDLKDNELISRKIEEWFQREFKYSLNLLSSQNPVEDLLFKWKEGHCEYFASSMAVLLRHLGIPSRVVNGFKRGEFNSTGRYYVVREKDAHSWVEVYIKGKGWIPFDPTPSITASYKRNLLTKIRDAWDAVQFWWDRNFVTYSPQRQITIYFGLYENSREFLTRVKKLKYLLVLFILFLFPIIYILTKRKKRKKVEDEEEREYKPRRISPVSFYNRFLKIARSKGFSIWEHETPFEFFERIKRSFLETDDIYFITDLYYKVRYGGLKLKKDDIIQIEDILKKLKEKK